ncbi:MAG: PHP domain-containing protein [Acidimicrobiia bacterium]|nr:PHP domain-containing protein [Acidimicrobiia bacterium]
MTDPTSPGAEPAYLSAIDRVIYLLDRGAAPTRKVRAFQRGRALLAELDRAEVEAMVARDTLTDLDGIGPSIASVVAPAVEGRAGDYLNRLEQTTAIEPGAGGQLRADLRGDCHSHSTWSDGGAAIRAMAATAQDLGHEYLVVTDHSERLTVAHGLSPERLAAQRAEIDVLNEELAPFRLLSGLEVDIMEDGSLDLADDVLARLDVVIASVHRKIHQDPEMMTKRLVTAAANPHVDILGHCTNRKLGADGEVERRPSRFDADYVFAACARFGTAVEINCRPERRDPPDELLDLALEWDCLVSIDSDAHSPGQLEWVAHGCDKAAGHGIGPAQILNTRSADALLDLLAPD